MDPPSQCACLPPVVTICCVAVCSPASALTVPTHTAVIFCELPDAYVVHTLQCNAVQAAGDEDHIP